MDEANENTIRDALSDQLRRCEARCARLQAELESLTKAMQQSDAANVALATQLEKARADTNSAERKLAELIADVRSWTNRSDDSFDALCEKYEVR
jgi:chromosome segregation ATPase